MLKQILIKPIISEKSEILAQGLAKYSFVVNKAANKIEIKNAVEANYGVTVASVNTINVPSRSKVRNTKSGIVRGSVSGYKKAVVSLVDGEEIDFFGEL